MYIFNNISIINKNFVIISTCLVLTIFLFKYIIYNGYIVDSEWLNNNFKGKITYPNGNCEDGEYINGILTKNIKTFSESDFTGIYVVKNEINITKIWRTTKYFTGINVVKNEINITKIWSKAKYFTKGIINDLTEDELVYSDEHLTKKQKK